MLLMKMIFLFSIFNSKLSNFLSIWNLDWFCPVCVMTWSFRTLWTIVALKLLFGMNGDTNFLALMENVLHYVQLNRSYPIWVLVWAFFLHFYVLTGRCPGKYLGVMMKKRCMDPISFSLFQFSIRTNQALSKRKVCWYVELLFLSFINTAKIMNIISHQNHHRIAILDLTIIMTMILSVWSKRASSPISVYYVRSYHI